MSIPRLVDLCANAIVRNPPKTVRPHIPEDVIQAITSHAYRKGKLDDNFLLKFAQPALTNLSLEDFLPSRSTLSSASLVKISVLLGPNLVSLNLSYLWSVTDSVMSSIFSNCKNLRTLLAKGCHALTEDGFCGIESLTQLEILHVDAPERHITQGIKNRYTPKSLQHILALPNVKEVSLKKWSCITDDLIELVGKAWPELSVVNLVDCRRITDVGIEKLVSSHPQKFLFIDLSGLIRLSDKALENLSKCSNLQSLVLKSNNKVSDAGISSLLNSCKELHSLSIAYLDNLTPLALKHIADAPCINHFTLNSLRGVTDLTNLTNCKSLITLSCHEHPEVTDEFFRKISENSPQLEEIYMENCPSVTNAGMIALASHCRQLQILFLGDCPKFSDDSLVALGKHCPGLNTLIIGRIRRGITDTGIIALAQGCPQLKNMDILHDGSYNPDDPAQYQYRHISDRAVRTLASCCPNLSSLSLRYLDITDDAVSTFNNLVYLNVRGCRGLTPQGIDHVINNCHNLQTLTVEHCPQLRNSVDRWKQNNIVVAD